MGDQAVMGEPIGTACAAGRCGLGSANVLMDAAHPLLDLACRLKLREVDRAIEPLRAQLCAMIDAFDERVRGAAVDEATRMAARYCLCTFVDEIVAAMPAGGAGAWASRSLLVLFHKEASGGERFFSILHELARDSAVHLDVLELIYVMLALGMEGRYRLLEDGRCQLNALRSELRRTILAHRGAPPPWPEPTVDEPGPWGGRGRRPLQGLLVAGSLTVLALLIGGLEFSLHEQALPVVETLSRIRVAKASSSPLAAVAFVQALTQRLAPDVDAHRLSIDGAASRAVLTLGSDSVFASGSATVLRSRVALVRRIGIALRGLDGRVVVIGHTDDESPSSGAPSNWQLSLSRAAAVVNLLREEAGGPERFLAQGRGASEPIAPNDSPANRARNRRVVITVVASGAPL